MNGKWKKATGRNDSGFPEEKEMTRVSAPVAARMVDDALTWTVQQRYSFNEYLHNTKFT